MVEHGPASLGPHPATRASCNGPGPAGRSSITIGPAVRRTDWWADAHRRAGCGEPIAHRRAGDGAPLGGRDLLSGDLLSVSETLGSHPLDACAAGPRRWVPDSGGGSTENEPVSGVFKFGTESLASVGALPIPYRPVAAAPARTGNHRFDQRRWPYRRRWRNGLLPM